MSTSKSVSGVLGMFWVGFGNPTQIKRPFFEGCRRVCWVCWVWRRVRACVTLFMPVEAQLFFSMRGPINPTNSTHLAHS
ncbi:hypothetical protein, partial [Pseudomonas caricapapayae]|uniref:hypothetical protein n=1 Tax=Pseudomonas caricapapayae TaxID=46678 RepID=UPI001CC1C45E